MSRRKIYAGSTSNVIPFFVNDNTSTSGAGLGSLVYNSSGLAAKYRRQGGSWTSISLVTATAGTFTSGGFVADGGPVTGGYELGSPDAACASGATWVQFAIYGATNMLPVLIEFELDAVNYQDAVRHGATALPNAACNTAGGLASRIPPNGAGTATAGGSNTITLQTALGTNNLVNGNLISIISGTGAGQTMVISGYVDSTKVVTISQNWVINPDNTSVYVITNDDLPVTDSSQRVQVQYGTSSGQINLSAGNLAGAVPSVTGAVGSVTGSVGSVTGSVGSISGITFPTNFNSWSMDSSGRVLLQPTQTGVTIPTVTTVTNQLTGAQIATSVWQDSTSGDFTAAGSIGKSLFTSGNAPGAASGIAIVGSNMGTTTSSIPSVSQIATAVWQDTTAGDFTTAGSIGKSLFTSGNVPGASNGIALVGSNMGTTTTSIPSAASIATAVWQDTTAGDFNVASSIGKSLYTSGNVPGAASGLALVGSAVSAPSGFAFLSTAQAGTVPTSGTINTTTPPTAAAIATTIFTDSMSGTDMNTAGSFGALIKADINAPIGAIPTTSAPSAATVAAAILKTPANLIGTNSDNTVQIPSTATPPTTAQIAAALFVDGATNKLKVNSDNTVNAASSGGGSGTTFVTITVNDGTNPLQGAKVTLTINSSVYYAYTGNGSSGTTLGVAVLTPNEGNGNYGVAIQCNNYQFQSLPAGSGLQVSGNTSHTYSMTQNSITPPTNGTAIAYAYTFDGTGATIVTGVAFTYQMLELPSGSTGVISSSAPLTATSDSNGRLLLSNLLPNANFTLTNTQTGASLPFSTGAANTTTAINGGIL